MKTIMILIDQFYLHGGIEKLVSIKANYWAKLGYNVVIVSTEQNDEAYVYPLSDEITFIDLDVSYNRAISYFHYKNLKFLRLNIKRLRVAIKNYNPDLILVASHIPMTYVLPFLNTKTQIAKEFHFSKYAKSNSWKNRFFETIENKYDFLVVLSHEEQQFYKSENVVVIPNPVTTLSRVGLEDIKARPKIAGAVLRFAPVKQLDKMVSAWALFYEKNTDWKLYIYGDTNEVYYKTIQTLVDEKHLNETVIFKGQTAQVADALKEMQVLLMTSANECFPMVILEANSCGVPVVSFDSPTGPRNIITTNVDGLIVPLNNVDTFAEELSCLVNDKERLLQFSLNAIENSKSYQLDHVMSIWQTKIFDKL